MELRFDHLVIAARELAQGAEWVEARLGVEMSAGGKHPAMGTHNRVLSLGPGRFLEVIAIDPEAPAPGRPRWFDLDAPAMQERLARGPALIHWVARTDDLEGAIAASGLGRPEIMALARGAFRWRIGVPADGALLRAGTAPTFIQWFTRHPSELLPDSGCRLEALVLRHPEASATLHALRFAGLDPDDAVQASHEGSGLEAVIRGPRGRVELRE